MCYGLRVIQDYQVDVESTQRRLQQQHMVQWIVDGVVKGITPQQVRVAIHIYSSRYADIDLKTIAQSQWYSVVWSCMQFWTLEEGAYIKYSSIVLYCVLCIV